jgi:hypothetical protein
MKYVDVIKSENKLKELARVLGKKNSLQIIQAIKSLREKEPFEGAIGLLTEAFDSSDDRSVHKIISEFFNDLKDLSARHEIIAEIRKPWNENTMSMLVSSCWQSGLDYSDYMEDIINIFVKGDFPTSIECMTVIEGSVAKSSRERRDGLIKTLKDTDRVWVNEKKNLTLELLSILEK